MFIATYNKKRDGKKYTSTYIVESYRNEKGQPRHKRLLNISGLEANKIEAIKVALQGGNVVNWDKLPNIETKEFGIPYFTLKTMEQLDLSSIIKKEGAKHWSTIVAMVASRISNPCSKHAIKYWADFTSLKEILGEKDNSFYHHKQCYNALDFLADNQEQIEDDLFQKRTSSPTLFLYDITSSYFEGSKAEGAKYGYSRDHRKDCK